MAEPFFEESSSNRSVHPEILETPYEFFNTPQIREEIFTIGKKLATYTHDEEIKNIVFVDRAARPAYIALKEYWKAAYPQEQRPHIYFVNPRGFKSLDDLMKEGLTGFPKIIEEWAKDEIDRTESEDPRVIATDPEEVREDFERTYRHLMASKDQPTLIFDTCIHDGGSSLPIRRTFRDSGFTDLKFGVVADELNYSGVLPDFTMLPHESEFKCYPFHRDSLIQKTFSSTASIRRTDDQDVARGLRLRGELNRVMHEQRAWRYGPDAYPKCRL